MGFPDIGARRAPLAAAGQSMMNTTWSSSAPQLEPARLLATAYDSNWLKKRVVPRESFPGSSAAQWRPAKERRPQRKPRRPATLEVCRSLPSLGGGVPISPTTVTSPGGTRRKKEKKGSSLPKFMLGVPGLGSRPGSAGSKDSKDRKKGSKESAFQMAEEAEPQRTEKPLGLWAEEAGVPLDIASRALETYLEFVSKPPPPMYRVTREQLSFGRPFDARYDLGGMDPDHFGKAILRIADCKDFTALPPSFLEKAVASADKDSSGDIDFLEFLNFYYKFSFSEEVCMSPEEREIRLAARQHDIPYYDIGQYKDVFDQTDTNRNGSICFDEFLVLVTKLLKVPKGESLHEKRARDLWSAATRELPPGEDLDFITFAGWYKSIFGNGGDLDESPAEAYYKSVRRVSCFDASGYH